MKVDGVYANLLQGISQQHNSSRLPGQCTDQINAIPDVVDGWKRRPPTEFIAKLLGMDSTQPHRWHFYDTGAEQYVISIAQNGTLHIFDLLGNYYAPVNQFAYKDKLVFTTPRDISAVTIGDYTLLANSRTFPQLDQSFVEAFTPTALIYLKDGGEYGRKYTVSIGGVAVASYTTPGGSTPGTEAQQTGTEYVTQQLYSQLNANVNMLGNTWSDRVGNTSFISYNSGLLNIPENATATTPAAIVANAQYTLAYEVVAISGTPTLYVSFNNNTTRPIIPKALGFNTVVLTAPASGIDPNFMLSVDGGVSTAYIQLRGITLTSVTASPTVLDDYTFNIQGSIIEVRRIAGTGSIPITATDDRGGQFAKIIQHEVAKPGDLPKFATPGHIIRVTGEGTSDKDDYYLKFIVEDGIEVFGTAGVWRECAAPDVLRRFDADTMPVALIRLPDSTWLLTPLDGRIHTYSTGDFEVERWRYRSSGDEDSNPTPSFVGKSIVNIGTFQDRLYFLSDESACFSATNSYFNYWNKTATAVLDSDPVDMPSAGNTVVKLKQAVQHDKNLILFADKAQFVISGAKELTPKSSMLLTTSYDSDLVTTTPIPAGSGVLFPITYGDYAGLREFITTDLSDTNSSQPITANVPKLIKGTIEHMAVSSNFDTVLIKSSSGGNRLYVYKYLWQEGQRQQSAWGKWDFSDDVTVQYVFIQGAYVYLVLKGTEYRLERIDLTDVAPDGMLHNIYIDSRTLVTPAGNVLTLPYEATNVSVVQGSTCAYPGSAVTVLSSVAAGGVTTVNLAQAIAGECFAGIRMTSTYEPSMPVIKDQNGGVVNNASMILSKFLISYRDSGSFTATVKNPHYPDYVARYSGRTLGLITNKVGELNLASGAFSVSVRKTLKFTTFVISTDTHLPLNLMAIEWEGDYTKRGRRL